MPFLPMVKYYQNNTEQMLSLLMLLWKRCLKMERG